MFLEAGFRQTCHRGHGPGRPGEIADTRCAQKQAQVPRPTALVEIDEACLQVRELGRPLRFQFHEPRVRAVKFTQGPGDCRCGLARALVLQIALDFELAEFSEERARLLSQALGFGLEDRNPIGRRWRPRGKRPERRRRLLRINGAGSGPGGEAEHATDEPSTGETR